MNNIYIYGRSAGLSIMMVIFLFSGCRQSPQTVSEPGNEHNATQLPIDQMEKTTTEKSSAEPKNEMLPAYDEKRSNSSLVGGCADLCGSPKVALESFLRELFSQSPSQEMPFVRFIDTSILKDNQTALGDQWAGLFLAGKLLERQQGIDSWAKQYSARVGKNLPTELLEAALGSSVSMYRISSGSVRFSVVLPAREDSMTSNTWQLTLSRRGLEWLVSEIVDNK